MCMSGKASRRSRLKGAGGGRARVEQQGGALDRVATACVVQDLSFLKEILGFWPVKDSQVSQFC